MASLYSLFSLAVFSCLVFSHCFAHAQQDCRYATCDVPTCRYPVSIPGRCCSVCRPKAGQRGPSEKCPRADISLPCGDTCRVDTDCPATQKCCDHGCGKSCRDRVTISSGACPYGYPKPSADCQKLSGAACPTGYYCKYALAANKAECCPTSEYQGYTPPCHNAVCTPVYCSQPYIPQGQCCPVCPPQASAPPAQQPYMQQQQQQQQSGGVCANVMCPDIYCYNPVLPPGACCYVCPEATTQAPVPQHHQQPQHFQPHQQNIQQVQQGFQQLQQSFQQQQPPPQQQAMQSQPMDYFQTQSQQQTQPQFQPQQQPQFQQQPPPQPQVQQQVMAQPQPQPQPSHQPSFFDSLMCAFAFCQDVNCPGSFIPPGECCHVCPPDPCAGVMCSQVTCPNPYVPDGQCCLTCPPDRPCVHNGKSYKSGQIFAHDCNNCTCNNGNLYCTNQTCEQKCNYNGRIYSSGVTVSNTICQTCTCGNGVIYCTEDACTKTAAPRPKPTREIMTRPRPRRPPATRAQPITRAPPTYPPPTRARDPCSGVVCPRTTCQVTYQPLGTCCPICLNKGECLYEGKMYKNGEIQSANNCQKCTCMDGMMVCSNDCIQRATPPPRRITTTMYVPRPTTRGPPPAPPPRQRSGPRKQSNGRRGPPPGPPPPARSGAPQGDTYPRPPLLVQTYEEIQAASNKRLAAAAASKRRAAQSFQTNPGPQANLGPQYNPGPQYNSGPQYNPVPPMSPNPRNLNPRNPNPRPPGNMPVRAEVYDARPRVEPSRRTPARTQAFQYEQMLEGPISRSEPSPGLTYKDIKEPLPTRIYPNTMAPRFRPHQPSPRYPALRKRTYPPVPARPGSSRPIPMGPKTDPRADRCTNVQCVKPNCPNYVIPPGECCPICKPKKKLPKKPGQCPPVLRAGLCVKFCDTDHDCKGNQICCFNGCSQQCFDPVSKT